MLDIHTALREEDGKLYETAEQEFDSSYLAGLKWARQESMSRRCDDFVHVASVPVVFVHKAIKEGLNFYNAPAKEIVAWLRKNDLTDFIVTGKNL
jgi:hypothetical protein